VTVKITLSIAALMTKAGKKPRTHPKSALARGIHGTVPSRPSRARRLVSRSSAINRPEPGRRRGRFICTLPRRHFHALLWKV